MMTDLPGAPESATSLHRNLDAARVKSLPPNAYYIANFISEEEEAQILKNVGIVNRTMPPGCTA
jgi:hypothetical protein